MKEFSLIKQIQPESQHTFEDKVFLTFDVDWACDEVINYTLDILDKAKIKATIFFTHNTSVLDRIKPNPMYEVGLHPNFNFLLAGDTSREKNFIGVIENIKNISPASQSIRSHSMTQNSNILQAFFDKGFTHDCNHFIPEETGIILKPWYTWHGLIKVPYFWEDDVACIYKSGTKPSDLCSRDGLKVFDFHPIHVFLNTSDLELYEKTRAIHAKPEELAKHRFAGKGTKDFLEELISV